MASPKRWASVHFQFSWPDALNVSELRVQVNLIRTLIDNGDVNRALKLAIRQWHASQGAINGRNIDKQFEDLAVQENPNLAAGVQENPKDRG